MLFLYRTCFNDAAGDPLDHGVIVAKSWMEATYYLEQHLRDLLLDPEDPEDSIPVIVYPLAEVPVGVAPNRPDDPPQTIIVRNSSP